MEEKKHLQFDVAVVGGGVVGAAAAWKLSKAGARVALIEKGDLCAGASATNPGFCVLSYRENALVMELALRQQGEWDALQSEIGDVEYAQTGGIIPLTDEKQVEALSSLCRHANKLGLSNIAIVTPHEAKAFEPALDEARLVGACVCPGEGRVNPFKLNLNMAYRAKALGATLLPHTAVTGVVVQNQNVRALETESERTGALRIEAELFVFCGGAWTAELCRMAGREIPVYYERGEAMVSMQTFPRISRIVTDGALFTQPASENPMVVGACLAQTRSGNIVMAQATSRPGNYDKSNTFAGPRGVAKRVLTLFPSLSDLDIIRMWAGLVSYAVDKKPVFGAFETPKNLLVANSFHSAIALSPAIGDMVATYWQTGEVCEAAKGYTPERF